MFMEAMPTQLITPAMFKSFEAEKRVRYLGGGAERISKSFEAEQKYLSYSTPAYPGNRRHAADLVHDDNRNQQQSDVQYGERPGWPHQSVGGEPIKYLSVQW